MGKELTQEEIIELAVSEGVKVALKYLEYERSKEFYRMKDTRKRNIHLLLRNFRELKVQAQNEIDISESVSDDFVFETLASMTEGSLSDAENILKSVESSPVKSAVLVNHILSVLDIYKTWCERSCKEENKRRYRVIYAMYIDDEIKNAKEISRLEMVDKSTVFKDIRAAIEMLAFSIFGFGVCEAFEGIPFSSGR